MAKSGRRGEPEGKGKKRVGSLAPFRLNYLTHPSLPFFASFFPCSNSLFLGCHARPMASNVAGPSKSFANPVIGGMSTIFGHNSGGSNTTIGSSDTTIYPPQPYGLHQSSLPNNASAHTSPSTSASKTNKSESVTDNTSTGSTVNGLSRKRNASASPGNDSKEKKARGEGGGEDALMNSPGSRGPKSAANGSPTDVRAWGEEAAK